MKFSLQMSNMESNSAATPVQSETPIQDLNQQASNMSQSSTISQSQAHQGEFFYSQSTRYRKRKYCNEK